jgi:hypothetical protein
MEKVEVITRHKSGNPKEEKSNITWIEFLSFIKPESENEMNKYAIHLLNGSFLHSDDGFTYFLTGLNLRDNEEV